MASRVAFSTWESVFSLTGEIQKHKRPSQQNVGWLTAALIGISVGGGSLLSTWLKLAFDRQRPELALHAVAAASASFPSGHAMLSAVTYLTVGGLIMRTHASAAAKLYVFAVAMLLTVAIGVSRVYLGVHWPTDVLAGWCAGAAWALLFVLIDVWLERWRNIRAASHPPYRARW